MRKLETDINPEIVELNAANKRFKINYHEITSMERECN